MEMKKELQIGEIIAQILTTPKKPIKKIFEERYTQKEQVPKPFIRSISSIE